MRPPASDCGTTSRRATPKSAAARWRRSKNTGCLRRCRELAAANRRATWRNWLRGALRRTRWRLTPRTCAQFLEYFSPPETAPPAPAAIDLLMLREWLAWLYGQKLSRGHHPAQAGGGARAVPLPAARGVVRVNVARLVRTPKAPQKLPEVMTAEQANALVDGVGRGQAGAAASRARPRHLRAALRLRRARQRAGGHRIWRISTAPSAGCACAARAARSGRCPLPGKAAEALERYLGERPVVRDEPAVFLNHRGGRLTDRGIRGIVKFYATLRHRRSFASTRTASATPTPRICWPTAPTCAPSRNCWATRAFPPRRNTRRCRSPT